MDYIYSIMKLELPEFNYCPRCGSPVDLVQSEGRIRPVCSICGHIIYVNPAPAVALAVLDGRKVLLTLRSVEPKKGWWCLPGGFLEWGESPVEGGRRELFEETGIQGSDFTILGAWDSITAARLHVLVVAYHVGSWSGNVQPGDDAEDVRWFDADEIPPLAFEVHVKALRKALEAKT